MLTPQGLQLNSLPGIINNILTALSAKLGSTVSPEDSDPFYQHLVVLATQIDAVQKLAAVTLDQINPNLASFPYLDGLSPFFGNVERLGDSKTSGPQDFTGTVGTQLFAGFTVENTQTGDRYTLTAPLTLRQTEVYEAVIDVVTVNTSLYSVVVDNKTYAYEAELGDTAAHILEQIYEEMLDDFGSRSFDPTLVNNRLVLTSTAPNGNSFSVSSQFRIISVTNRGIIEAEEPGPLVGNVGAITKVITNTSGLLSTRNPQQMAVGRFREEDEEYRERMLASRSIRGKAVLPAIAAALRNVPGVSFVTVAENSSMSTSVEGFPPKSVIAVVDGGTEADIASVLAEYVADGIETYGDIVVPTKDSEGIDKLIKFFRPASVYVAVKVEYSSYEEEPFPVDGAQTIANATLAYINALGLGKDVIPDRIKGPAVYSQVTGVGPVTIYLQVVPTSDSIPDPGDWSTDPLSIPSSSFAQTTLNLVSVEEV